MKPQDEAGLVNNPMEQTDTIFLSQQDFGFWETNVPISATMFCILLQ